MCKDFSACSASSALKDRKSTRLNSSHLVSSYAVFCLKKKTVRGRAGLVRRHNWPLRQPHRQEPVHADRRDVDTNGRAARGHGDAVRFHALFFFSGTPTTGIYTLSLHDALPI